MKFNETEVNNYLQPLFGRYEDSFQQAWVDILECNPQTLEEITPIIRRIRNKAIKQYFQNLSIPMIPNFMRMSFSIWILAILGPQSWEVK